LKAEIFALLEAFENFGVGHMIERNVLKNVMVNWIMEKTKGFFMNPILGLRIIPNL
jgi:hypothetical protein